MNWNTEIDIQYWVLWALALVAGYAIHRITLWFLRSNHKAVDINDMQDHYLRTDQAVDLSEFRRRHSMMLPGGPLNDINPDYVGPPPRIWNEMDCINSLCCDCDQKAACPSRPQMTPPKIMREGERPVGPPNRIIRY